MMTEQVHGSSINHSKTMPPPSHKPLTMHTFSSATPRHSELVEPLPITMDFIRIEIQCTEYGDQTRLQSTHASHRILLTASTLHRVNARFRTGMASIQPCMDPAGFVAHANHAKPVAERKQHLPRRIPPNMEFPGDKVNGAPVDIIPCRSAESRNNAASPTVKSRTEHVGALTVAQKNGAASLPWPRFKCG